jgi:multiple sugar transport system substrate-binding protein
MKLAASALALALGAASCSGAAKATSRIALQIFGDPAEISAYKTLIDAFHKATMGVRVDLVSVPNPGDHMAKLATAFAGGTPPDLFLINYRRFGQFAAKGVLEPLGARLAGSKILKEGDFYPEALDAFRFGDNLLCLPQNISSQAVYYNKGLFKRFRVPEPGPGWNWTAFLATAKSLTRDENDDGTTDVYGLGLEPNIVRLAPFIWQAGGEVVDDTTRPRRTVMLGAREIEAMRFFIELRRVHKVVPSQAEAASEEDEARFGNGRLGMLIDSRRATATFRQIPGLDWDVAPLPVDRRAATMLHSDAYCMAKASRSRGAAFRFVEFALGPQGAAIIAKTGRTVPSVVSVARGTAFLDATQRPARAQVFLDAIPTIRRLPNIAAWNEIETKADVIIEEWFYGTERPEALGIEIDLATRELFAGSA